jgi:hypothetical protein
MNNNKTAAGVLTLLAFGIAVSFLLASKKYDKPGRNFLKRTKRLTSDLKEKFGTFVDELSEKMQGGLK